MYVYECVRERERESRCGRGESAAGAAVGSAGSKAAAVLSQMSH